MTSFLKVKKLIILSIGVVILLFLFTVCSTSNKVAHYTNTNIDKNRIVLHHTAGSPYAEKIRLMLGYTNTNWYSLIAPSSTVNRPVQEKFVGGYSRRIPIMQIGSDIYCDSYTITNKIAEITQMPELGTLGSSNEVKDFIENEGTERIEFFLNSLSKFDIIKAYFKNMGFREFLIFIHGRYQASKNKNLDTLKKEEADKLLENYINTLNNRLKQNRFLFSSDKPNLADFSAYHLIWWLKRIYQDPITDKQNNLKIWYQFMTKLRKQDGAQIAPETAYEIARNTKPLAVPDYMKKSDKIGKEINLLPNDFCKGATLPIKGILVGENEFKYILKRETPETGIIHVHFPKLAYGACL